jgi:asparagine synthase (glutamine-hydrolysing)
MQMYLPSDILRKVDLASMAHGLEVRPPLLDDRVLAVAQRLPRHLRLGRGRVGKAVLKEVLRRRAPKLGDDFIRRRKTGFALPRSLWMSEGHRGQAQLLEVLAGDTPLLDWFRAPAIRGMLERHAAGVDMSGPLWLLLVLGLWLRAHPGLRFT